MNVNFVVMTGVVGDMSVSTTSIPQSIRFNLYRYTDKYAIEQ